MDRPTAAPEESVESCPPVPLGKRALGLVDDGGTDDTVTIELAGDGGASTPDDEGGDDESTRSNESTSDTDGSGPGFGAGGIGRVRERGISAVAKAGLEGVKVDEEGTSPRVAGSSSPSVRVDRGRPRTTDCDQVTER